MRQSNRHKAERKAERKVERKTDRKIVHKADRSGTRKSHKPAADKTPVPKSGGTYSVGIPYQIAGERRTLKRTIRDAHFMCRTSDMPAALLLTGEVLW